MRSVGLSDPSEKLNSSEDVVFEDESTRFPFIDHDRFQSVDTSTNRSIRSIIVIDSVPLQELYVVLKDIYQNVSLILFLVS